MKNKKKIPLHPANSKYIKSRLGRPLKAAARREALTRSELGGFCQEWLQNKRVLRQRRN